jgi:hypothetical protein
VGAGWSGAGGAEVGAVAKVCAFEFVGLVAGRAAEKLKPDLGEVAIVRTWGAAVLRPYDIVRAVFMWVMLRLNPAILETIAATGWRTDGLRQDAVKSRFIAQKARDGAEYLASLGMTVICDLGT